ncbi:MAG TPA: serine/threonine protein phosphatase [Flavobacteriaceae bacterium]|nr:metallophosphoesterase family protein [Flavobacteriaceae bacterium]HPF11569.1 serine/threonine protein phosphatase [Flavobacteriaceae bacterium]HQU21102.1 serine/threonine protein phosphatase [Flavobacteriaceae bacterium]HQU65254.1 serine/threonine protein phosphatase [Flavobacteriaceae bacterium]HRW43569.1 serine/threonine protein phosphatase [Flavobacteriaceae bacterium]
MSSQTRFDRAYRNAPRISFNDQSKFILFSDCHRGDNSFADDFANNRNIYFHALKTYYHEGFTYCELGDGDELWENRDFKSVFESHKNVYELMQSFFVENRLYRLIGNHDMVYKYKRFVAKTQHTYFDKVIGKDVPLFPGIQFTEGLVLQHEQTGQEVFLVHGHQADFMNYVGWKFNRFMVRVLWRQLQIFGIGDPTSPAKNYSELIKVEKKTKKWIAANNHLFTIIGHTHRPRFPDPGEIPFFNDGSCVHPRCITGLEIENGAITLIKWQIATADDGALNVIRVVLEGPRPLADYQKQV